MERIFYKPYKKRRTVSPKDYDHKKMLGAAAPLNLPKELLALTPILDQGSTPWCTAETAVAMRRAMTGAEYDPELQWKAELQFMGVKDAPGSTIQTQLAVGVKVGFFKKGEATPGDKADAYFFVKKNGFDWFDACRSVMNQLYQKYGKVIPLSIGLNWFAEWDNTPYGIIPDSATQLLGGHDTEIPGFQNFNIDGTDYIVIQGSWGTAYGDNGIFRVSREVFNKYFDMYGAGYWVDDPNLEIKRLGLLLALYQNLYNLMIQYFPTLGRWLGAGETETQKLSFIVSLLTDIVNIFKRIVSQKPIPPFIPTPAPAVTPAPQYLWDTPANARHSVRVICDEEGLSFSNKNILTACVQVESGFNTQAVHQNKNALGKVLSTDWGIVQVNDYYHIGPGKDFPSVDYVLTHPEECVRWMCRLWKAGKQNLWTSYVSKAYLKHL